MLFYDLNQATNKMDKLIGDGLLPKHHELEEESMKYEYETEEDGDEEFEEEIDTN